MQRDAWRFAILSDAHIISPGAAPQHGVDARRNLEAGRARLAGVRPSPELVVHLGDQTSTPSPAAYAEFVRITRDLPMPQIYVHGNHDDGAMLAQALPLPSDIEPAGAPGSYYALVRRGVQLVVLNSSPAGHAVGGQLDSEQLTWLDRTLADRHRESTVLFVHHHCHPIGIDWLDGVCLQNADELMAVLQRHRPSCFCASSRVTYIGAASATVGGISHRDGAFHMDHPRPRSRPIHT